jgi:hypothetical protein
MERAKSQEPYRKTQDRDEEKNRQGSKVRAYLQGQNLQAGSLEVNMGARYNRGDRLSM